VLVLQPDVFDFQFPKIYLDVLAKLSLLTFDLPKYVSVDCLVVRNYHSTLYVVAVFAAGMVALLIFQLAGSALVEMFRQFMKRHADRALQKQDSNISQRHIKENTAVPEAPKFLSACLISSYLIYPSCTAVFSNTFNCREIDGVKYLTKDLSINCASDAQQNAVAVAGLMLVVFSVGLPVLYLQMLHKHRPGVNAAGGHEHAVGATGLYGSMQFFYDDYQADFYYWEVIEIIRKLILTAVTVQFPKGSMIQVELGAAVIVHI
jgi:hypothetical protein